MSKSEQSIIHVLNSKNPCLVKMLLVSILYKASLDRECS
jgi:hypothetical protein